MKIIEGLHAFIWSNPTANNCNTYLIDREKRVLIDPGHYHLLNHVRENLSRLSLSLHDIDVVIITHLHPDHVEGVKAFSEIPVSIAIHKTEMEFIKNVDPQYGESLGVTDSNIDILLQEGDLRIGNLNLQVIDTPGHSPGSICLYWPDEKVLFTGDVVFNQGIGRTDLPAGNGQQLMESIKKISVLHTDYLLPGHGDIISGRNNVMANFEDIERMWFGYL